MGPPPAVKAIKKCIEFGADEGYMISDRAFAGADTLATSYALTKAIEKISKIKPVDLVICGKMTIDGDTGQVGPGIARRLDIPPLTSVQKVLEVNKDKGYLTIERKLEDGYEEVQSTLPCLLTVEKDINDISYAPLPNMIKASCYLPTIWSVDDLEEINRMQLGLKGSPTVVSKIWVPEKPKGGKILEGSTDERVKQIIQLLQDNRELFKEREGM